MENTNVTIRYNTFNTKGELVGKEKSFKNQAAAEKWIAKQEQDNGNFLGVEAWSK